MARLSVPNYPVLEYTPYSGQVPSHHIGPGMHFIPAPLGALWPNVVRCQTRINLCPGEMRPYATEVKPNRHSRSKYLCPLCGARREVDTEYDH
jgi:hypothetical protein